MPSFSEACEQSDERLIRSFIKQGIEYDTLNARDKTGKTGLSHACSNGFVSVVRLLQLPQVDVNLADNEGNTPLIFAAQAGHSEIVGMLLHRFPKLDINHANKQGFTALMKAAIQGRVRCAKWLLVAGADPYKRDFGRRLCALEWAEYCTREACVTILSRCTEISTDTTSVLFSPLTPVSKWKSDSTLDRGNPPAVTSSNIFKWLRRKPMRSSNSTESSSFSPWQSTDDLTKMLYPPVFTEQCIANTSSSDSTRKLRQVATPTVTVTLTSKDDNYYCENFAQRERLTKLRGKFRNNLLDKASF